MDYRLAAADMDGTLLNSAGRITEYTEKTVREVQEKGFLFTVSTGRPFRGVEKYNEQLRLNGPVITYNGAKIVDARSGETLYEQGLRPDDARRIWELAKEYDTTLCIWAGERLYANRLDERVQEYKKLSGAEPELAVSVDPLLEIGVTKMLWDDERERIGVMKAELAAAPFAEVTYCTSQPEFLEFFSSRVSKAAALERIGTLCGVRREEMIALGDGLNDLEMIGWAGLGVAMANAAEEVRNAAHYVTASNDEDGVARTLRHFLLKEPFSLLL